MTETYTLKVSVGSPERPTTIAELDDIVRQINGIAAQRKLIGALSPNGGQPSLQRLSHTVLPTARRAGNSVRVEVELLDTSAGTLLQSMVRSGMSPQGVLRGYRDQTGKHIVVSVDIDLSPTNEFTVLDDIVEALEEDDLHSP